MAESQAAAKAWAEPALLPSGMHAALPSSGCMDSVASASESTDEVSDKKKNIASRVCDLWTAGFSEFFFLCFPAT